MFVFLQNSYVEILTPKMMVLGGGASWKWLGHEGRAFTNGISALIKEAREFRSPFHHWRLQQALTRLWIGQLLDLGFPSLRNREK